MHIWNYFDLFAFSLPPTSVTYCRRLLSQRNGSQWRLKVGYGLVWYISFLTFLFLDLVYSNLSNIPFLPVIVFSYKFLKFVGTGEMFEGRNNSFRNFEFGVDLVGLKKPNNSRTSESGMEFESDWMKHRKSLVFTAQAICFTTSIMAWSSRIPMNEGFHEFI